MTLPYWLLFAAAQEDAFAHKNLPSYSKLKQKRKNLVRICKQVERPFLNHLRNNIQLLGEPAERKLSGEANVTDNAGKRFTENRVGIKARSGDAANEHEWVKGTDRPD